LKELASSRFGQRTDSLRRIASCFGDRISFLDMGTVRHFVARVKLMDAVMNGREHRVDQTIADLE
jgi:hypothetical protein